MATLNHQAFTQVWSRGQAEVYAIRWANLHLEHSWPRFIYDRINRHWWLRLTWLALISSWPIAINAALLFAPAGIATQSLVDYARLIALASLDGLMLFAAKEAWEFGLKHGSDLDAMLATSPDAKSAFDRWLGYRLRPRAQLLLPAAAVLVGELYYSLWCEDPRIHYTLTQGLAVAYNNAIGGNIVYWLAVAPGVPTFIRGRELLDIRWHNPASTPGLRLLSHAFGITSFFLLLGAAGILLPAFLNVPGLSGLVYYLFAGVLVLIFRVAFYVYIQLYLLISAYRRSVLEALDRRLPRIANLRNDESIDLAADVVTLYDSVHKTASLPFSTSVAVQYAAALSGVIVAFVINYITQK